MFLHLLNQEQQENFVGLANELIGIDGLRDDNEIAKIQSYASQIYGNEQYDFSSYSRPNDLSSIFNDSKSKNVCLLELIGLCYVDGEYCIFEQQFVDGIRKEFSISSEDLTSINNWVKEMVSLTIKGAELITLNN